jgi:opacity protein-like surface antigen
MIKRAILAMALAAPGLASAMSYDYVELAGMTGTVDTPPTETDTSGFLLGGSFAIHENVAVAVSGSWQDFDTPPPLSIKGRTMLAGLQFHFPLSPQVDVGIGAGFGKAFVEATNFFGTTENDDTVTEINASLRAMPVEKLEIAASVTNTDSFGQNDTGFAVGARVYVQEKVSLGLSYLTADDLSAFIGGIRIDI